MIALAVLGAACNIDAFKLADQQGTRDGGPDLGDGGGGIDAGPTADAAPPDARGPDAGPDACPSDTEVCDGQDNDCDGEVDEDFDFDGDSQNCGGCGIECRLPNTFGTCETGTCVYECRPNFHDLNDDLELDGCEYLCGVTNGGEEACDFADNDCDGETDEGFDLDTDVDNCGGCGRPCLVLNATPECTEGVCGFSECDDGFEDLLPGVPGCEYDCPVFPPEAQESCNGVDDDCDGLIDESPISGLGDPCVPEGFEEFGDTGACELGATACSFGTPFCADYVGPTGEQCNGIDDDCDGETDEIFDTDNDPRNCGPDCEVCSFDNAVAGCSEGSCVLVACNAGFVDANGDPSDGCEYECTPTGPEVCDGIDNDCDRDIDTDDDDLVAPSNFCLTAGACAGTEPVCGPSPCDPTVKWRCLYGGATEADTCGDLPIQESLCDGVDGDCDTRTDEAFPLIDSPCNDGELGACLGTGVLECADDQVSLECNITDPGASPEASEIACDNVDEDCDGVVDEGAPDTMVRVTAGGLDFMIDVYEASRPDATTESFGAAEHRACSNALVLPWRNVSYLEAEAACAAAGKRLCTEAEWQAACEGELENRYPYGTGYDADACNGNDYDHDCTPPDQDICLPTGTAYGCPTKPPDSLCVSDPGAFDMSGNLKEWTATQVSMSPPTFRIRGGAFDSTAGGLTCDFDFVSGSETFSFSNLGFRCCAEPTP